MKYLVKFGGKTFRSARKAPKFRGEFRGKFRQKFRKLRLRFFFFGNFVSERKRHINSFHINFLCRPSPPGLSKGQTGFVPGTNPGLLGFHCVKSGENPGLSQVFPGTNPGSSQDQPDKNVYVYVPFFWRCLLCSDRGKKSTRCCCLSCITSNQRKGGNLVQWRSSRQDLIAKSTCEADLPFSCPIRSTEGRC